MYSVEVEYYIENCYPVRSLKGVYSKFADARSKMLALKEVNTHRMAEGCDGWDKVIVQRWNGDRPVLKIKINL